MAAHIVNLAWVGGHPHTPSAKSRIVVTVHDNGITYHYWSY